MTRSLLPLLLALAMAMAALVGLASSSSLEVESNPWTKVDALPCDLYVNFQIDLSNSMHEKQLLAMRAALKEAVSAMPKEGKLYYQFSTFAQTATAVDAEPRLFEAEAFAAAVDRAVPAVYSKKPGFLGQTNHGAAVRLGYEQTRKAQAKLKDTVGQFLVLVVTDGETTWQTKLSKSVKRNYKAGPGLDPHTLPCYKGCELDQYADKLKEGGAKLGVLFLGKPRFAELHEQAASNPRLSEREREAARFEARDYKRRREHVKEQASPGLARDLEGWHGLPGTLRSMIRTGCTGERGETCDKMHITVLSDISRSTIVGRAPGAHVRGVWEGLLEQFGDDVMIRIFAFASETYDIVPEYVPVSEAAAKFAGFNLGLVEGSACEGRGIKIEGADEAKFVEEFKAYYDVRSAASRPCVGYFRDPAGKFHWLKDDTFLGKAIRHAKAAEAKSPPPAGGKSLYVVATDASGYDNKRAECRDAFAKLKEAHDKVKAESNIEGPYADVRAHRVLMERSPELERAASTCCDDDERCNIKEALGTLSQEPVVLLFVGATFRSDTAIETVRATNRAHGFDAKSIFVGDYPAEYPALLRQAMDQSAYLSECVRRHPAKATKEFF